MELPEDSITDPSALAESYVALIQKQMNRLSDELADGQALEVIVPLADGTQIIANRFGAQNPDMVKVMGLDSEGNEVCLLSHKNAVQVLLKKVSGRRQEAKPESMFQLPAETPMSDIVIDETA